MRAETPGAQLIGVLSALFIKQIQNFIIVVFIFRVLGGSIEQWQIKNPETFIIFKFSPIACHEKNRFLIFTKKQACL